MWRDHVARSGRRLAPTRPMTRSVRFSSTAFTLACVLSLIACGDGTDGMVDAAAGFEPPVCPPCEANEICVVTCDGDSTPDAAATCVANPLDCPTDPGLCSSECEESLCGAPGSPYSCTSGYYCPRADDPAFYCQGS
jgi:hypothetical protein